MHAFGPQNTGQVETKVLLTMFNCLNTVLIWVNSLDEPFLYNFIHHQTIMKQIMKKKQTDRKNKELGYINYHRTKSVTTQPIFSSKNITSFSRDSTGKVKIELHIDNR